MAAKATTCGDAVARRKRVLFLIGQLGYGGSEKQMALAALGLRGGFDVEVLCTSRATEPFGPLLEAEGIRVRCPPTGGKARRLVWLLGTLRRLRYDVLFVFSTTNVVALLAHLVGGGKLVQTERSHGLWKSRLRVFVDGLVYRRAALIMANAEATARFVVDHHPWATLKLRVVHNGIETSEVTVPAPGTPPTTFCLVARFVPLKGHSVLLDAVARLAREREDFRVVLVGDGPLRREIVEAVASEGLQKYVEFEGWRRDPLSVIARSNVNMNVSVMNESQSNAIMEGMLMGRPSIVTKVGGNEELVKDGVHGVVVPSRNPEALAEAMRFFIRNPTIGAIYGASARARIVDEFSLGLMVRRTRELLETL